VGPIPGTTRHEARRVPARLDDDLAAENPVRCIETCGEALALATRRFHRGQAAVTGRPASPPGALLTRSMDGDLSRLRSSRRLEPATHRHVALRWLLKPRRPAPKTIANGRRDTLAPRRQVWRAGTRVSTPRALFLGEVVALDGSQCQAVQAPERHCPPGTRPQRRPQLDERIEASRKARDRGDNEEGHGTPGGASAEPRHATMAGRKQRQL
jgi:hypothetical protein